MDTRGKNNVIGRYMWTWTANKFAKFHEKDLTEVKIFQDFLKHPVHEKWCVSGALLSFKVIQGHWNWCQS